MAAEGLSFRPYAPPQNIITFLKRIRGSTLPQVVDQDYLGRLGIPTGNANRVLQALRFLCLLPEDGHPTDNLKRLQVASVSDYPTVLGHILREAYSEVFEFVDLNDPSLTFEQVSDAFRTYDPHGQNTRMVTLFLGLCKEAEMIANAPTPRSKGGRPALTKKANTSISQRGRSAPPASDGGGAYANGIKPEDDSQKHARIGTPHGDKRQRLSNMFDLYREAIPEPCEWTQEEYNTWLEGFIGSLKLFVKIKPKNEFGITEESSPVTP